MITCKICKEEKSLDLFYDMPGFEHGKDTRCKECHNKQRIENKARREKAIKNGLLYDGVPCQVCGIHTELGSRTRNASVVDHCHETGDLRGILCKVCNTALGTLGDNAAGLRKALAYLERYETQG